MQIEKSNSCNGWLSVSGSGSMYTFSVTENTSGAERSGSVTFIDQTHARVVSVSVKQTEVYYCTITFNTNGGQGSMYLGSKTVAQGSSMEGILPDGPAAPTFKMFDGWYDKAVGGELYDDYSKVPYQDKLTLYAHWTTKGYEIRFDGNGADSGSMKSISAAFGKGFNLPANLFDKNGYVFEGWNTEKNGTGQKIEDMGYVINLLNGNVSDGTSITLYAQWALPIEVLVRFDVNGGNDPNRKLGRETKTVIYTKTYGTLPGGLTHPKGLIFDGWETIDGRRVDENTLVDTVYNHVLRARWKTDYYTIHFNGNGNLSGSMDDKTCKYGESFKIPKCEFDRGDGFDCWCTSPDGTGRTFKVGTSLYDLVTDTSQTEITLYAMWHTDFTVEYYDGFFNKLAHKDEKDSITHVYYPWTAPEVEGLTFIGWTKTEPDYFIGSVYDDYPEKYIAYKPGTPIIMTENLRVYPVYVRKTKAKGITVYYYLDGGVGGPGVEYYEDPEAMDYFIPASKVLPTKDGYVCRGWTAECRGIEGLVDGVDVLWNTSGVVLFYAWWEEQFAPIYYYSGYEEIYGESFISMLHPTLVLAAAPDRDDYEFTGWKALDGKIYSVGDMIVVKPEGITLTAQWKRKEYTIIYRDDKTGRTLFTQKRLSSDSLTFTPPEVIGMEFKGWMYYSKFVKADALVSDFVKTSSENTEYVLETVYNSKDYRPNCLNAYYNMNGGTGGPTEPSYGDLKTGMVITSTERPTRKDCVFLGWSTSPKGKPVEPGKPIYCTLDNDPTEVITAGVPSKTDTVILYAIWGSQYKCILGNGGCPGASIPYEITALPGETIELLSYDFGKPKGYTLLGFRESEYSTMYAPGDSFTVPARNITLHAVWVEDECVIKFVDDISGSEISRKTVKTGETIAIPEVAPDLPGYNFIGWSVYRSTDIYDPGDSRYGKPVTAQYHTGQPITVKDDITLYTVYEALPVSSEAFTITYRASGAEGGPGQVYYTPGEVELSTEVPTREGFIFLGWDKKNPSNTYIKNPKYPVGKKNIVKGAAGETLTLYAVWKRNSSNDLKYELESIYGPSAINDAFFDKPYESTDWERINDKAYYVVRTEDAKDSYLCEHLKSTVMVLEYKNGSWNLSAYGTDEGLWESIRLDILSTKTDTAAEVLDCIFDIVDTAAGIGIAAVSVYCPAVGYVVSGAHLLNKAAYILKNVDKYDFLRDYLNEELPKVLSELALEKFWDDLDGMILGSALEKLADSTGLNDEVMSNVVSLFKAAEKSIRQDIIDPDNADPFGVYNKAITSFKERVKSQGFNSLIVNRVYSLTLEIY
ncbi:MAG: InlB B-repeat-containing protein, partial [Lachnospiraceae bacterium]|nr:InlB B-repeat-containing protein [Lachnospiraceae bacterium]